MKEWNVTFGVTITVEAEDEAEAVLRAEDYCEWNLPEFNERPVVREVERNTHPTLWAPEDEAELFSISTRS